MAISRKHHFISQFYLAGFTNTGKQDGDIYSIDVGKPKIWKTTTQNIGYERDFNIIATETGISDELEKEIARFESAAAVTFKKIIATRLLPEGEDYTNLVNFIGMIGVRRPKLREDIDSFETRILTTHFSIYLSTKERWEAFCKRAKEDGATGFVDIPYQEAKALFDRKDIKIKNHPSNYHSLEFNVLDSVIQLLAKRDWSLVIAPDDLSFITSDQPVCLNWTLPGNAPMFGPGYGSLHSMVVFPISKELCLFGKFNSESNIVTASDQFVAALNSTIMMKSRRFLYSPTDTFICIAEDMSITDSSHYFGTP